MNCYFGLLLLIVLAYYVVTLYGHMAYYTILKILGACDHSQNFEFTKVRFLKL